MAALPFDSVAIDETSGEQRLSLEEFLAIPLGTRVRWIMEKRLRFFRGGSAVDRGLGLRSLMVAARQS